MPCNVIKKDAVGLLKTLSCPSLMLSKSETGSKTLLTERTCFHLNWSAEGHSIIRRLLGRSQTGLTVASYSRISLHWKCGPVGPRIPCSTEVLRAVNTCSCSLKIQMAQHPSYKLIIPRGFLENHYSSSMSELLRRDPDTNPLLDKCSYCVAGMTARATVAICRTEQPRPLDRVGMEPLEKAADHERGIARKWKLKIDPLLVIVIRESRRNSSRAYGCRIRLTPILIDIRSQHRIGALVRMRI